MSFRHALPQFLEERPTLHNATHVIGVGLKFIFRKKTPRSKQLPLIYAS